MSGTSMGQQMPPAYTFVVASGPLPVAVQQRRSYDWGSPRKVCASRCSCLIQLLALSHDYDTCQTHNGVTCSV